MLRNGFGAGLPKKRADRFILLAALAKLVAADEAPDEREVTGRLKAWLAGDGARLSTDAATLRRALIDEGFLERDGLGTAYRRSRGFERHVRFADAPALPRRVRGATGRDFRAGRSRRSTARRSWCA